VFRRFKPNLWARPTEEDKKLGVKHHEMPRSIRRRFQKQDDSNDRKDSADSQATKGSRHHHHSEDCLPELEREYTTAITESNVEEVWFAGCHCGTNLGTDEVYY
jgi:hypothetical protein